MNHWIMMPLLIPAVMAPLIVLTSRFDILLARVFCVGACSLMLVVSGVLLWLTGDGSRFEYELGNWASPFGIVLVLDQLAAALLCVSAILGFIVSLAVMDGWDDRGRHFHSLFLLQLMGVNGAFLTGDLFNLFVYFEVLLIASYGLAVHSGGPQRLRSGVQFVVINLVGSSLFLVAVGLIYGVTGTLNIDDLGQQMSRVPLGNRAILSTGFVLLLVVFAIKAALVPFQFWLPGTYAHAPPPVAALFALATKVGVYALIRFQAVVLHPNPDIVSWWVTGWIIPVSLLTVVVGMMGILASRSLGQMVSYATMASSGTIMVSAGLMTPDALGASLYYAIHSTLSGAAMFLVVDVIASRRPREGDLLIVTSRMPHSGLISSLFFVSAITVAGMPPLSGFLGKLLILDATVGSEWGSTIWTVLISTSLLAMLGFARAGSTLFWKSFRAMDSNQKLAPMPVLTVIAIGILGILIIAITLGAGSLVDVLRSLATQLLRGDL